MPPFGRLPGMTVLVQLSLLLMVGSPAAAGGTSLRNVVYVMVDDLRSQLSCYGHNDTVRTPNVDRLAASGTLFRHAYVSIAVCSPSRSSFLTGLRPQQQNVLNFRTDFRHATPTGGDIVTLPQWFKATGYTVSGMGKTFHPNLPPKYDEPLSWSSSAEGGFPYVTAFNDTGDRGCPNGTSPWCSMIDHKGAEIPPNEYADGQLVTEALRQMDILVTRDAAASATAGDPVAALAPFANPLNRAFFMAVGLHRPHMDWVVPPSALAEQPPAAEIKLAQHPVVPNNTMASRWAFYNCTELTGRPRLAEQGARITADGALDTRLAQTIRREYYAAVEYMDSQVGRLLDGLDDLKLTDSTVVVFHGDNGWKLGELGQWCKETVFENDARVPLLIRAPWITHSVGRQVSQPVELIDVFVTLADLAGAPMASLPSQLEGKTLAPLLAGAPASGSAVAFTIYPRWREYDDHTNCFKSYSQIEAIGLSVRTATFRLTDWTAWNASFNKPDLQTVLATELYDHREDEGMGSQAFDSFEVANLAEVGELRVIIEELRGLLVGAFGSWPAREGSGPDRSAGGQVEQGG